MQFELDKTILDEEIEIKKLQKKFIMHSGVSHIIHTIKESVESKALLREIDELMPPDSICLIGEAGAGKTAICEQIESLYPSSMFRDNLSIIEHQPILSLSVPFGTLKGLTSKILSKLGDPNPYQGNTQQMTDRIIKLLETTKTNLIILDEFHNLIAEKNHAVIVKWVKSLINETKIPVMVVGTPEVRTLITQSAEISRRFRIMDIEPFDYQFTTENTLLKTYVNTFSKLLSGVYPKILYEGLTNPHSMIRLYLATLGNVSNINSVMINSFICAKRNGQENVRQSDMSKGYLMSSVAHVSRFHGRNPFELTDKEAVGLINKILSKSR